MKMSASFLLCFCFCLLSLNGCGGGETKVIEAPPATDDASAMDGMDDDEYNKAMNESLNNEGS